MATYTVRAPDGKTITLQGPEGASQAEVIAQAQRLYQPKATPAQKPKSKTLRQAERFVGLDQPTALEAYRRGEEAFERSLRGKSESVRREALELFRADPRMRAVREAAGLAPVYTRKEELRGIAKRRVEESRGRRATTNRAIATAVNPLNANALTSVLDTFGDVADAGRAAVTGSLGLDRLGAAIDVISGRDGGRTYSDQLDTSRAETSARREQSTVGNVLGTLAGGAAFGGVGGAAVRGAGAAIGGRAGQVLQTVGQLREGQRIRNAARLVGTGGVTGGAQAAVEGTDVSTGAATGATAVAALGALGKTGQLLSRPVRDFIGMTGADKLLRRITRTTRSELAQLAQKYRDDTFGAEPTVFELLPLADRNRILSRVVAPNDEIVEQTTRAIRARGESLGPEMAEATRRIVEPARRQVTRSIARDLRRARGGDPLSGEDLQRVRAATESPLDMEQLPGEEFRAILAPFANQRVADNIDQLLPIAPRRVGSSIVEEVTDPEVAAAIRAASSTLRNRRQQDGVTVDDISGIMTNLRKVVNQSDDILKIGTAQKALDQLQQILEDRVPQAAQAAREAADAYAARSRMYEGMGEGMQTRLRQDVQPGANDRAAQRLRNAYDTSEGAAGRLLGQINRLTTDLGGSPEEALRATISMSRNSIGRELAQNIGPEEAARIMAAARAQDESARTLASISNKLSGGAEQASPESVITEAVLTLNPGSFAATRLGALRRLSEMTYIPKNRARTIVDMLFSQDPRMTKRAINALRREEGGERFLTLFAQSIGSSAAGIGQDPTSAAAVPVQPQQEFVEEDSPVGGDIGVEEDLPVGEDIGVEEDLPADEPYGRQVIQSLFPEAEITDDVRDPNSPLGQKNPNSYHVTSDGAVDVRPIPGVLFEEFVEQIKQAGYPVIEAIDETVNPSSYATGPHWHIVIG